LIDVGKYKKAGSSLLNRNTNLSNLIDVINIQIDHENVYLENINHLEKNLSVDDIESINSPDRSL
jgi:hypothetical protein